MVRSWLVARLRTAAITSYEMLESRPVVGSSKTVTATARHHEQSTQRPLRGLLTYQIWQIDDLHAYGEPPHLPPRDALLM
eukprot:29078-Eustigmatos_ZCMA.PRE.1